MKQGEFKEIMVMSRNEFAMPFEDGVKRELAINQIYIDFAHRYKIDTKHLDMYQKRQAWLRQQLKQRERG